MGNSYKSYLCCSGLLEQFNDGWDGVASHDRIVDENNSFARKVVRQRPKFLSHPELTQTSIWLNKRPADVAVFTQDLDIGQARLERQDSIQSSQLYHRVQNDALGESNGD